MVGVGAGAHGLGLGDDAGAEDELGLWGVGVGVGVDDVGAVGTACGGFAFSTTVSRVGRISRSCLQVFSLLQVSHFTITVPWYCPGLSPLELNLTGRL